MTVRILYLTNCFHALRALRSLVGADNSVDRFTIERTIGGSATSVAVAFIDARIRAWTLDIEEALATEQATVAEDWAAIREADGAVYIASPESHLYRKAGRHLEILRRDLVAAGKDPDRFPLVFEVLHGFPADQPVGDEELAAVLVWPTAERIDSQLGHDHARALDRVVALALAV